ncbi:MAG: DNA cytosine methyltransferase [Saccharospirillaceae bacterium]|nr:DNA cytosine methyltransferase [Saccharospirillaceae bacterium]
MKLLINKDLNLMKNGKKRIWLEHGNLIDFVKPGTGLKITDVDADTINVMFTEENTTRTVSKRNVRGVDKPLIEISEANSDVLKSWADNESLRIVVTTKGLNISINKNSIEAKVIARERRFNHSLATGKISIGSVFSGFGGMDYSAHKGFEKAGIKTKIRFAIDNYEPSLINIQKNLSFLLDDRSMIINSDISELNLGSGNLPTVNGLYITPPCVDASVAGKAKKKNTLETSKTCNLAYYYNQIIERSEAGFIILENVIGYMKTASFQLLTSLLEAWRYRVQIRVIESNKEGYSFEDRKRMYLVATSEGLAQDFCINDVINVGAKPPTLLGDFMDTVPVDDKAWKDKLHLIEKQDRDKAKGSSFTMQVYDKDSRKINTLRAQVQKSGSSDPLIQHPITKLFRIPTSLEHAKAKGYPVSMIAGLTEGASHFGLGNSVIYNVLLSLTYFLGLSITGNYHQTKMAIAV